MRQLRSAQDIADLVEQWGFLPFFANEIEGFSIEEHCPAELWFSNETDGPWEWKAPAMRLCGGMYGKLFRGKAGYVSRDWLPHFANFRRDGYDFDSRVDEGGYRASKGRIYLCHHMRGRQGDDKAAQKVVRL